MILCYTVLPRSNIWLIGLTYPLDAALIDMFNHNSKMLDHIGTNVGHMAAKMLDHFQTKSWRKLSAGFAK